MECFILNLNFLEYFN